MKIESAVDRSVLMASFRYALGRKTYIVNDIVTAIIDCWDDLMPGEQVLYHREIKRAISNNKSGMNMDILEWQQILELKVDSITNHSCHNCKKRHIYV